MYNFKLIHVQITFGAWSAYSLSCFCRATRRPLPQTAPNLGLGLHHSWRNRRKSFIFVKHSASWGLLVSGCWKSSRCNPLRTLNRPSRKRNFRLTSRPSILVYIAIPLTRNTQTVIGHTNLCNKYGGPWTLAILALPDNLTFDLTHLIRMHIEGKL